MPSAALPELTSRLSRRSTNRPPRERLRSEIVPLSKRFGCGRLTLLQIAEFSNSLRCDADRRHRAGRRRKHRNGLLIFALEQAMMMPQINLRKLTFINVAGGRGT